MKIAVLLSLACLVVAIPASAKERVGWQRSGDSLALPTADIAFPTTAGSVAFVKMSEFSRKGEGLDNVAQYESADGALFATIYVYRPAYPDAALSAYRTDLTIRERFGGIAPSERGIVAAPGRPGTVIRLVYPAGSSPAVNGGAPIVTAAAFLRVSGWIVKLRATAPAARQAEMIGALDALIAGMKIGRKAHVYPAQLLQIVAPCPAGGTTAMLLPKGDKTMAATLAAIMSSAVIPVDPARKNPLPPVFPANGLQPACVRGTITFGGAAIDLLQPAGVAQPDTVVGLLNDAGTMIVIDRALVVPGYDFKVTQVGVATLYGSFDRIPSSAQIAELLSDASAPGGTKRASVSFTANGNSSIDLITDPAKP